MKSLENGTVEGESPVAEMFNILWIAFPSTAGHEEPCGKLGGPPPKTKYSHMTDSAQVP